MLVEYPLHVGHCARCHRPGQQICKDGRPSLCSWRINNLGDFVFFFFFNFLNVFIFERERETQHRQGKGQRERETRSLKQAPGSELSAQSPTRGWNSQTTRSWPEPKWDAQQTEPPRRPYWGLILWQLCATLFPCISFWELFKNRCNEYSYCP